MSVCPILCLLDGEKLVARELVAADDEHAVADDARDADILLWMLSLQSLLLLVVVVVVVVVFSLLLLLSPFTFGHNVWPRKHCEIKRQAPALLEW